MSAPEKPKTVSVNIDGKELEVPAGINVVEAAALAGKEIPHYCYHPKLSVAGNCRMCLVETGMPMKDRATGQPVLDEKGQPKVGWAPKPAIGCATTVSPGLHVKTDSPVVKECQKGVMEFLLVNHPLDCPICDQAGECRLQEYAADYGRGYSRFVEEKNVKPKRTVLGPRVILDDERCILCSRCVRFCREVAKDDVLGFTERGSYTTLTCYPGRKLENNYSLNTVDLCPVGALTSTDFRFKMRVWFLKTTNSICTESSVGANTQVWSREGVIYRITPRRNDAVNDCWMTDSGRMLYKQVEAENRITVYALEGRKASAQETVSKIAQLLKEGKVAYVASAHQSVEEQWLLKRLSAAAPGAVHLVQHVGEGDGLLMSADRTPNMRGALLTGLVKALPGTDLKALASQVDAGEVKTVFCVREDLTKLGLSEAQLRKVNVVLLATHETAVSAFAQVVAPALTVFERAGTFVNQNFRLQKFMQAVPGPSGVLTDVELLAALLAAVEGKTVPESNLDVLWAQLGEAVPQFKGLAFRTLPETGALLDASAFNGIRFPEGPSLHYIPANAPAAAAIR